MKTLKHILTASVVLFFTAALYSQSDIAISSFPYTENFESQNGRFILMKQSQSGLNIDTRAAKSGYNGLLFNGNSKTQNWVDSAGYTTSLNAWVGNFTNIASASILIDGRKAASMFFKFDLKQTYNENPTTSRFRVLVNGKLVKDNNGDTEFYPNSVNTDEFRNKIFDLTKFTGKIFLVTLQSCCKNDNDCAFIDNLSFTNSENVSVNNDDENK
jgi:hypothetical protein